MKVKIVNHKKGRRNGNQTHTRLELLFSSKGIPSTLNIPTPTLAECTLHPMHPFIQDFQNRIRRISRTFRHTYFPTLSMFEILGFPKTYFVRQWFGVSLVFVCEKPAEPQSNIIGFGVSPLGLNIMKRKTFWFFGKWKLKVTSQM